MRVKLNGRNEFDAMVVIVRLVHSGLIGCEETYGRASVQEWCRLCSLDRLLVRLALIAVRWSPGRKIVRVELDEMQMATLYEMLQQIRLPVYERNLANRIISAIEREYYNERVKN